MCGHQVRRMYRKHSSATAALLGSFLRRHQHPRRRRRCATGRWPGAQRFAATSTSTLLRRSPPSRKWWRVPWLVSRHASRRLSAFPACCSRGQSGVAIATSLLASRRPLGTASVGRSRGNRVWGSYAETRRKRSSLTGLWWNTSKYTAGAPCHVRGVSTGYGHTR